MAMRMRICVDVRESFRGPRILHAPFASESLGSCEACEGVGTSLRGSCQSAAFIRGHLGGTHTYSFVSILSIPFKSPFWSSRSLYWSPTGSRASSHRPRLTNILIIPCPRAVQTAFQIEQYAPRSPAAAHCRYSATRVSLSFLSDDDPEWSTILVFSHRGRQ